MNATPVAEGRPTRWDLFGRCLTAAETAISRVQAEQRMFQKLDGRNFMDDMRRLLAAGERDAFDAAAAWADFIVVFDRIIRLTSGAAWTRADEMRKGFAL